ncbi:MAG: hypothetical protein HYW77_01625 [Parcubacteria group bacterium]|nr:hypothetical protein [Parcubacteria group bacterium]
MALGPKDILKNRSQEFADLLEGEIDNELERLALQEITDLRRLGRIELSINPSLGNIFEEFGDEAEGFFLDKKTQKLIRSKYVRVVVGWSSVSFKIDYGLFIVILKSTVQKKNKKRS